VESEGARGAAAAREFKPDLILLDVVMPGIDGGDVSTEIQEDPQLTHTPIVFLTASVTKHEVSAMGGTIGDKMIISKMMTLSEIVEYVKKILGTS
jgi:CheY-like chemotaxis protein